MIAIVFRMEYAAICRDSPRDSSRVFFYRQSSLVGPQDVTVKSLKTENLQKVLKLMILEIPYGHLVEDLVVK